MDRPKIFVICSGLGRINRGFESFFNGFFGALCSESALDARLFKGGGGKGHNETVLWNIHRNSYIARLLGKFVGRSGYFIEQLTFFLALLPYIFYRKPNIIYVSDVVLANLVRLLKKVMNCDFEILYCNGGPTRPEFLFRWSHIQQVSAQHLQAGLSVGVPQQKQTLLPHGVFISETFTAIEAHAKRSFRAKLGLPLDRPILLSVGAINKSRKRMDYVIREVAGLQKPRPFLLLLGQTESDSEDIVDLGKRLLSEEDFSARTVARDEVADYYRAADVFALASLDEGFGLVYVEAMSHGLPCLVHGYETAKSVLGEMGYYGDLTKPGALAKLISNLSPRDFDPELVKARHAYVYERFSWDKLKPKYVEMFQCCAAGNGANGGR